MASSAGASDLETPGVKCSFAPSQCAQRSGVRIDQRMLAKRSVKKGAFASTM